MSITTIDGFTTNYVSIPYYRTLWELNKIAQLQDYTLADSDAEPIAIIFRNLEGALKSYKPDGGEQHTLVEIGWSETMFSQYWYQLYKDRRVGLKTTIDLETGKTTSDTQKYDIDRITDIITGVIRANAPKYWAMLTAFLAEYDPIDNYSMIEESLDVRTQGTENKANTGTSTLAQTGTDSIEGASSGNTSSQSSGTESGTNDTTTTNSVAPYENQDFLNHDKSVVDQDTAGTTSNTASGTSSGTTNSTETKNLTDTTTQNLKEEKSYDTVGAKTITLDDTFSWDGSDTNQHGLRRKGNIGVTTSQQMLESEIALKSRDIVQEIYNDINHVVLLGVWHSSPFGEVVEQ